MSVNITFFDELKIFFGVYESWYLAASKAVFVGGVIGIFISVMRKRVEEGGHTERYKQIKTSALSTVKIVVISYIFASSVFFAFGAISISHQHKLYESISQEMSSDEVNKILGDPDKDIEENSLKRHLSESIAMGRSYSHALSQEWQGGRRASEVMDEYLKDRNKSKIDQWSSKILSSYIVVRFYDNKAVWKSRGFPGTLVIENEDFPQKNVGQAEDTKKNAIRFVKYSDGIVVDETTGLKWYEEPSGKTFSWNSANKWARQLTLDNGEWRLPTLNELATLYMSGTLEGVCGDNKFTFYVNGKVFSHRCWIRWASDRKGAQAAYFFFGFANPYLESVPRIEDSIQKYAGWGDINKSGNGVVVVKNNTDRHYSGH